MIIFLTITCPSFLIYVLYVTTLVWPAISSSPLSSRPLFFLSLPDGGQELPGGPEHVVRDLCGAVELVTGAAAAVATALHAQAGPHPGDGAAQGTGAQPQGGEQDEGHQQVQGHAAGGGVGVHQSEQKKWRTTFQ